MNKHFYDVWILHYVIMNCDVFLLFYRLVKLLRYISGYPFFQAFHVLQDFTSILEQLRAKVEQP